MRENEMQEKGNETWTKWFDFIEPDGVKVEVTENGYSNGSMPIKFRKYVYNRYDVFLKILCIKLISLIVIDLQWNWKPSINRLSKRNFNMRSSRDGKRSIHFDERNANYRRIFRF